MERPVASQLPSPSRASRGRRTPPQAQAGWVSSVLGGAYGLVPDILLHLKDRVTSDLAARDLQHGAAFGFNQGNAGPCPVWQGLPRAHPPRVFRGLLTGKEASQRSHLQPSGLLGPRFSLSMFSDQSYAQRTYTEKLEN